VQQWPHLRLGDVDLETLAVLPLAGIVLLASPVLVDRFERAPSRRLPNPWAGFTAAETRGLRWAAYAAALGGGLVRGARLTSRGGGGQSRAEDGRCCAACSWCSRG
jgi:hypothetical protein